MNHEKGGSMCVCVQRHTQSKKCRNINWVGKYNRLKYMIYNEIRKKNYYLHKFDFL